MNDLLKKLLDDTEKEMVSIVEKYEKDIEDFNQSVTTMFQKEARA